MRRILAAAVLALGMAQTAHATGDLYCWGEDQTVGPSNRGKVFMHFVYRSGISSVLEMTVGEQKWSSYPDDFMRGATPIYVTDANDTYRSPVITADFTLAKDGPVVATLRTYKTTEGQPREADPQLASSGVFNLKGVGSWPVACFVP